MEEQVKMASPDNSRNQEQQERTKRSITLLAKTLKSNSSCTIEFNENGQPVRENQARFASYLGVTMRSMIFIVNPTWKKVQKEEKDQVWSNIKDFWNIKDDTRKSDVLKQCNESWKKFKKILCNDFMDEGLSLCVKYLYVTGED